MFNLKRNQIIITVLVFMIAIAAYLNTQQPAESFEANYVAENETMEPEEIDFFEGYDQQLASTEANDIEQVSEGQTKEADNIAVTSEPLTLEQANSTESISAVITKKVEMGVQGVDVAASKNLEVSYFAEEKLLREQSRAEQIEKLTEWVENDNLDQNAISKAAANLIEIQERIEKENSAEALLKAKGFSEVYVRIDDDTVDVVVNKAELTDSEIAQIEEIVNRKTGYSVGKINITPLNGVAKTN